MAAVSSCLVKNLCPYAFNHIAAHFRESTGTADLIQISKSRKLRPNPTLRSSFLGFNVCQPEGNLSFPPRSRHRVPVGGPARASAEAGGFAASSGDGADALPSSADLNRAPRGEKPSEVMQTVRGVAAVTAVALVAAVVAIYVTGGPAALREALSKSGFAAAFSLIFVSEIGDKTFFIAALLAMKHSRGLVLAGAVTALGAMSVISVAIGCLFKKVPAQLQSSAPIGEYLAVALLVWFGIRSIRSSLAMPDKPASGGVGGAAGGGAEESSELAEAEEFVSKIEAERMRTPFSVFWEACTLVFVAEWGDRSMLATVALGAAQSPVGVASGAILGHGLATGIAVIGGSLLAKYISEKLVGLVGGILFLVFAVATLAGVF